MALPVIVVGSGPSGVHAAASLLEAGANVLMLDGGSEAPKASQEWNKDWETIRTQRADQYRLFWGENFEGLPWGELRAGAGLTPGRRHFVEGAEEWLPTMSDHFRAVESLAEGGLGGAWGLGAFALSDAELQKAGLPIQAMREGYRRTAHRVGISGTNPEARSVFTAGDLDLLPPLNLDPGAQQIFDRYQRNRARWQKRGVTLGKTPLALLSNPWNGRAATQYSDLDFYTDQGRAAYRPMWTLEELAQNPRFQRVSGVLVSDLREDSSGVTVAAIQRHSCDKRNFQGSDVVLCAGALGSARILLRSAQRHLQSPSVTGLVCSPYRYLMGLRLGSAPKPFHAPRHSMGQLVIACEREGQPQRISALGSLLSYRSLLLTRLLARSPLPLKDSRALLQVLQSRLQLTGAFFPDDAESGTRLLKLVPDAHSPTGDHLEIDFQWGAVREREQARELRRLRRVLWKLGCPTIAEMDPGAGGSIHYAGTVPFAAHPTSGQLSCDPQTAVVHGYLRVRVGDGSAFLAAPAPGITWSLMAFADQVGRALGENRSLC